MLSELIPISFNKIMQSRSYTVIILGNEQKRFAVYTAPNVGDSLQKFLTQEERPRPFTHDIMSSIFKGLNIKILQIVINDVEDTVYFARLFLEQEFQDQTHILEIDARPSDCLILALMNNIPVYCKKEIFERAIPVEE